LRPPPSSRCGAKQSRLHGWHEWKNASCIKRRHKNSGTDVFVCTAIVHRGCSKAFSPAAYSMNFFLSSSSLIIQSAWAMNWAMKKRYTTLRTLSRSTQ
jgi:hypothetical protein